MTAKTTLIFNYLLELCCHLFCILCNKSASINIRFHRFSSPYRNLCQTEHIVVGFLDGSSSFGFRKLKLTHQKDFHTPLNKSINQIKKLAAHNCCLSAESACVPLQLIPSSTQWYLLEEYRAFCPK